MKRVVLVYGLIAGVIVSVLMVANIAVMNKQGCGSALGMVLGYASMLLAFSFIFVSIKNYRDKYLGGVINFGKAFLTGLLVATIASAFYTFTWVLVYKNIYPDFIEKYTSGQLAAMKTAGKTAAEIAAKTKEMDSMVAMYKTWPGLIGFTLLEILPVGIIVSLIAALILKRKRKADNVTN